MENSTYETSTQEADKSGKSKNCTYKGYKWKLSDNKAYGAVGNMEVTVYKKQNEIGKHKIRKNKENNKNVQMIQWVKKGERKIKENREKLKKKSRANATNTEIYKRDWEPYPDGVGN